MKTLVSVVLSLVLLLLDAIQGAFEASSATSSSECCNTCIGKTSSVPYTYDPVVFADCTKATGGVCCFDCGTLGEVHYGDSVSCKDDGVTAIVKAGSYLSFTWSNVENVTYVMLKTGQKKTVTPTSTDTMANKKANTFVICVPSAGSLYFRGWGKDACRAASPEHAVIIEANDAGNSQTCDANDMEEFIVPSSGVKTKEIDSNSLEADKTVDQCSHERGSVKVVDNVRTCVCVSDWTHPPECNQWPLWKWLVTIAGGLATLFSIALSIRAFLQNRHKNKQIDDNYHLPPKKQEVGYRENLAPMGTKSDAEVLDLSSASGYHGAPMSLSKDEQRTPGGTRKPVERLFSL
ncbi:hypothetical protein CCR75_002523 [Bremia lactucae]|uniref:Uncharacterized protein n=1 Tax=Bremia lactucae TaxID=4779 RepID=A0A976IIX7_BRELC|nr:hypothetical protein CCR75_002523 [Bremia lactucae]